MKCPYCSHEEDRVVDSRTCQDGTAIRRRRECVGCQRRFTTYEYIENTTVTVNKADGRSEPFQRQKLLRSLQLCLAKRPIPAKRIEALADEIESEINARGKAEIDTRHIGTMVLEKLKEVDTVAYIRYASVHRDFQTIDEFIRAISQLLGR